MQSLAYYGHKKLTGKYPPGIPAGYQDMHRLSHRPPLQGEDAETTQPVSVPIKPSGARVQRYSGVKARCGDVRVRLSCVCYACVFILACWKGRPRKCHVVTILRIRAGVYIIMLDVKKYISGRTLPAQLYCAGGGDTGNGYRMRL